MSPEDIIVLMAETHELDQALDLMKWFVWGSPISVTSPSVKWWILKHAVKISQRLKGDKT